jgi:hypothetical protein
MGRCWAKTAGTGCARGMLGCDAGGGLAGCDASDGWAGNSDWAENERREGEGLKEKLFKFQKPLKQMNSNNSLNSKTQNNTRACMQQGIPILHSLIKKND